jgi:hypothetical protein
LVDIEIVAVFYSGQRELCSEFGPLKHFPFARSTRFIEMTKHADDCVDHKSNSPSLLAAESVHNSGYLMFPPQSTFELIGMDVSGKLIAY